jgi:prepilin-type processing-associated H-X9-DG protein
VGAWLGLLFFLCETDWGLLLVFVSSFCVKGVVVVAGFHMGVSGQAAGRLVKCVARPGKCALVTADGGPVPHFASLDEGERWLAEQEAAQRGGFAGGSGDAGAGVRDAFAPAPVGDGRGIAWDDALVSVGTVSAPNGVALVGPSADSGAPVRLVRGLVGAEPFGNMWAVPAGGRAFGDDVSVRGAVLVEDARDVLFSHVTGGAVVGEARGARFEHVYAGGMVGEAKYCFVGSVGGGELSPGVPGGGSVSIVSDGSVVGVIAGDEYGQAHVGRCHGGSSVNAVLADGHVDSVSGGSRVEFVEGADGAVATVGVVDVDSRVGVLGEYARVGFAVNADSVSDSADAARLLDARLRRESADGYGGGGLRVSEGVRRSLYSGEGVSVSLSVVARDGSSVVLGEDDVRRVLRGRHVATSWDVDAVFRSFESSFDRRAGEWAAGAGDVVLPPSGWDDDMEPFVDDDEDE